MRILVLDDDKSRLSIFRYKLIGSSVTCTQFSKECITLLKNDGPYDYLFLDHDLDGKIYVPSGPGTGYEVAEWVRDNPEKKPNKIIIHTCNEYAGPLMEKTIPESVWLPGVFMINFKVSDLDNLKDLYLKQTKKNNGNF